MKFSPYSFSRLATHDQCGRKFKYNYIDKVKPGYVDRTALLKGGAVHSIFEKYPEESTHKLAPKYQDIADKFINGALGAKYFSNVSIREHSFGILPDFSVTTYQDKKAMFRGHVDYAAVIDGVLHVIDWKSGKYKEERYQDFNQLMFYAIYFFHYHPKIDKIKICYVYVEHDLENQLVLERQYLENYKNTLLDMITKAESDTAFKKNPSKLCDYCDFKEHCEKDKT